MSKHTPGPWMFGIRGEEKPIEKPFDYSGPGYYENPGIFAADGTEIVGCDEYMIFNSPGDARLLTAAPDLLKVLEECRNAIQGGTVVIGYDSNGDGYQQWFGSAFLNHLNTAIAKATGNQNGDT
jgi:hypothetical protein